MKLAHALSQNALTTPPEWKNINNPLFQKSVIILGYIAPGVQGHRPLTGAPMRWGELAGRKALDLVSSLVSTESHVRDDWGSGHGRGHGSMCMQTPVSYLTNTKELQLLFHSIGWSSSHGGVGMTPRALA